ncbi:MAG: zinc-binding dehydrogenase [Acidimicrobiales bacterium]
MVAGGILVENRPDPSPDLGEILVHVSAAGINNADLLQMRGYYPAPPDSPADIPGLELAGVVVARGPKAGRFEVGDPVMAVVGGGAQAELAVVHERCAMPVPPGVEMLQAGAFPEAFTTAHDALFTQAGLGMGERVLIHGGAGGVGTAAIQLAVAAGARVTASVRDPGRRQAVADLGAVVIDPARFQDPQSSAEANSPPYMADEGPFDVILELVGAPNMAANLRSLAVGGRIVVIGIGGGSRGEVDLGMVMAKRAAIMGSTLRARPLEGKADAARGVEAHVLPLLESGWLQVPIHSVFGLDDAAGAYDEFARGNKLGKIVLQMAQTAVQPPSTGKT